LKAEKTTRRMIAHYSQLKQVQLRSNEVTAFLTGNQQNLHQEELELEKNYSTVPGSPLSPRSVARYMASKNPQGKSLFNHLESNGEMREE
jgi:hypothetical protein